jgi:hypothetical protein
MPAVQVVPLAHRLPQDPQLELSVCSSTQAVLHGESGGVHVNVHWPAAQSCAPTHRLPQLPQSFGSVWRLTHTPPQFV